MATKPNVMPAAEIIRLANSHLEPANYRYGADKTLKERLELASVYERWAKQLRDSVSFVELLVLSKGGKTESQ